MNPIGNFTHVLSRRKAPRRRGEETDPNPKFLLEGPWNIGQPVHELITQTALRAAGVVEDTVEYGDRAAWEFVRGVIWNDDPEGMLFDDNETEVDDWSDGVKFLRYFNSFKKAAGEGAVFGPGSALLARSHFGDLQCLHAMAARDGEEPEATKKSVMEWAEFLYLVANGTVNEEMPLGSVTRGRMFEWFPGGAQTVRKLFLVGSRGNVRQRAMGALLHVVQDSFARGHVERNADWEIVEFHSYVNQDHDKHKEGDMMASGGLAAMPNAMRAAEVCERILLHWKRGRAWSSLKPYMEEKAFKLAADARAAGPGEEFRKPPGFTAAAPVALFCNYQARGHIVDDDSPFSNDEESYAWGEPFSIVPGGAPLFFRHNKVVDDEVELNCVLSISMDASTRLYVSGEVAIHEGTSRGRARKDATTFGPMAIERETFADLVDTTLHTGDGGWGSFKLSVANEGD